MNALALLSDDLQESSFEALASLRLGDGTCLDNELTQLKSWLGGGTGLDTLPIDRIVAALAAYFSTQTLDSFAQARLTCHGCTMPFGENGNSLLATPTLFTKFLHQIDEYHSQPRLFRRCYRGLLNGYFSYDPWGSNSSDDGKVGWQNLREYLKRRHDCLSTDVFNPDWIAALDSHRNLLTDDPCRQYGLAALRGDRSAFDDIRAKLEIGSDSWLLYQLVHSQVDTAIAFPDTQYKAALEPLLELLSERNENNSRLRYELLVDSCLSKILNRYADCSITDANQSLRDFSVAVWKNPWLTSNASRWGLIRPEARDMVGGWLKLKLISQFFALLAEDGSNDTRRVEFWKQYHEEIDDMYFALGSSAIRNRSTDFKEIRNAMDGRLLQLYAAGAPTNNAFIMMIGEYAIVEFGTSGNAAYIFNRTNGVPFKLQSNAHVAGDSTGLKNQGSGAFVDRLIHNDTREGSWEKRFRAILHRRVGLQYAARNITNSINSTRGTLNRETYELRRQATFSMQALHEFAEEHALVILDRRHIGDRLWVSRRRELSLSAKEQLEAWGFRWSANRSSYYLEE